MKSSKRCDKCGQLIHSARSVAISTHFHAHITQLARETGMEREYVYQAVLLLACEIETDGGAPYPYTIVNDIAYPRRTSSCNNKQIMTAIEAAHMSAAEWGVYLEETPEKWLEEIDEQEET